MKKIERPLSPHLSVYKPQITSVLSIMHRGTGVFLSLGLLLLTCWLLAVAAGGEQYTNIMDFLCGWFGRLLLIGWSFAFFYHLCNGIRHLYWDSGRGFEIDSVTKSGWAVLITSVVLTAITWVSILGGSA